VEFGAEADTPYAAIVRKAEEWSTDIVVIGSHGRSPLGRMILGSVSQKVLAHAPCSVRVGRCVDGHRSPEQLSKDPPRLLLAIDGSPDSAAAAQAVRMRSWPAGTQVRVVTALDLKLLSSLVTHSVHSNYDPNSDAHLMLRQRLQAVAEDLHEAGLIADTVLLDGDPKNALVDAARAWQAECVFLGAKGHGRVARFLLGSVSAAVAARAHCSVEVVRHG
jgi:nucleotide-binding universal stress UspA family protein